MKILRLIVYLAVLFLLFRFVFVFRQINCLSEGNTLEPGVCEVINDRLRGKSIFFTDLENELIWEDLLSNQQFSQAYQYQKIKKSVTGKTELWLITKLPDYRLILGSEQYLLNQSNKLKDNQDRLILPSIEFMGDPNINQHGYLEENYHKQFLVLSRALSDQQIVSKRIVWQNDLEIYLYLDEIEVIMDNTKDFAYQIERLALILNEEELKAILPTKKILDLRFNLPVLK